MSSPRPGLLRQFLLDCDAFAEGRRLRILLGMALLQTLVAPLMDTNLSAVGHLADLRGATQAAGAVTYAGLSVCSLLSAIALITTVTLIIGGRAAAFSDPDTADDGRGVSLGRGLRSMYRTARVELRLLLRRNRLEAIGLVGLVAYAGLQSLRSVLAISRYLAWSLVEGLGLEHSLIGDAVVAVYTFEGLLALVAVLALGGFGVVLVTWMLQREGDTTGEAGRLREVRALRAEHPLLDLRDPKRRAALANVFHGDVVRVLFEHLAVWSPPAGANSEADIHDDLLRVLREAGLRVASEQWLPGRRRVDLVVDDRVAIELKWTARSAGERDRARSQVREYAKVWTARGPVLLIAVNAAPAHLTAMADDVSDWNASFMEPQAPILVLGHGGG